MSNILGVDFGLKNIGLALADTVLKIPYPLKSVQNNEQAMAEIKVVAKAHQVVSVVLGLPVQSFGGEGRQADLVRSFGEELRAALGLEIIFEDERFSSVMVKKMMAEQKNYNKDAIEAMVILESYLVKKK